MKALRLIAVLFLFVLAACSQPNTQTTTSGSSQVSKPSPESSDNNINFAENSTVYFDFDVSTPRQDEEHKVAAQANWLKAHKFKSITIEGHTDIVGTREYNLALGERRANSVKDMLVADGIDQSKIKVVSYGKEHLASRTDQAKNRRTVTKVELDTSSGE